LRERWRAFRYIHDLRQAQNSEKRFRHCKRGKALLSARKKRHRNDKAEYERLKLIDVELAIGHDQIAPLRARSILLVDRNNVFFQPATPSFQNQADRGSWWFFERPRHRLPIFQAKPRQ